MKKNKIFQSIAEFLRKKFDVFLILYAIICAVVFIAVVVITKNISFLTFLGLLFGFSVIFELLIRMVMRAAYGVNYRCSIDSYFLVDHPEYGNCFRKNTSAKKKNFLLFDKFIFKKNAEGALDLEKNIEYRTEFNINSLGFRGKEFSASGKGAKLRIFCSGGSTTACDHNDDDQTWPAQLERVFKEKGYDVEVINAGVQGWYSYQEFLRLKKEIQHYQPDIVLFHQGWNEEFEYSSLSLGKKWKAEVARSVREVNFLYSASNKFLSKTRSVSVYLCARMFLKKYVFEKNMKFTNPDRWEILKKNDYLSTWFTNLLKIVAVAEEKNFLIYMIDYPALVDMEDSASVRKYYVENSRLTPEFANYQAVSKKRISYFIDAISDIIPRINAAKDFARYQSEQRLELFYDEMHMSPVGNKILAEKIYSELIEDEFFRRKYEMRDDEIFSNVNLDKLLVEKKKHMVTRNPVFIDKFIDCKINELKSKAWRELDTLSEIPGDRYTTF